MKTLRIATPLGRAGIKPLQAVRNAPPPVDNGFRAGGVLRPSARRITTPPRVPLPRPAPFTAVTPAPATSPILTVSMLSDCERAAPVGTSLLRLTLPLGDTPPTPAKLDALVDAAKFQFAGSVTRYSHAD